MQYFEFSKKKLHFIVSPEELRTILDDFHHVFMNTGVRKTMWKVIRIVFFLNMIGYIIN